MPEFKIVVYEDITLIANFAINVYSVTLSAEKGNVVGGGDYNHGEEVEIEIIFESKNQTLGKLLKILKK